VDDTEWWHYPAVKRWSDLIRRYDTTNLLTCTLLDFRKPNAVADAGSWDQWQEWFHESHNFPLTYLYPLMRDGNYVNPVIDGGIEDIARLAEHVNEQVGYSYHHQWLQAHMQGFAYGDFGLGTWETFVASPEQLRLEMYTGLLANVKGIYLFSHQSLRDANLGRGRRNESGIVFREFDLVNDFITVGTLQDYPGESPHPQISIRSFTLADEELLVLLRHDPDYIRYVGDSTLYSLSIPLSAAKSAYRVEFPAIRPLAVTNNTVQLDSLDLTAVILLTNDSANIDSLQATIDAWMPDLASEALEVSRDKRAKTEVIAEKIATARELPAGIEALFDKGRQVYGQARWDFANQAYTASYQRSRAATLIYRKIQRLLMQQAEAYWQENLSGNQTAREYLIYFFGLPKFYERYANGSSVLQGELGTAIISRLHAFDNASATDEATTLPARVRLLPNYPNPFNGSTLIRYELSEKTSVRLSIFNLCGQLVDTLIVEDQPQGYHQWHFDAGKLPSGVYFCQLQTGSVLQKLKILLLK